MRDLLQDLTAFVTMSAFLATCAVILSLSKGVLS